MPWTFSTTLRYCPFSKKELPTFIAEATSIWQKRFGENRVRVINPSNFVGSLQYLNLTNAIKGRLSTDAIKGALPQGEGLFFIFSTSPVLSC